MNILFTLKSPQGIHTDISLLESYKFNITYYLVDYTEATTQIFCDELNCGEAKDTCCCSTCLCCSVCAELCQCAVAETNPNKKMASVLGLDDYWLVFDYYLVSCTLSVSYTLNLKGKVSKLLCTLGSQSCRHPYRCF